MATLTEAARTVKPIAPSNPRDSWPAWTDGSRWETTADEYRPTAGPDFIPSPEDLAEAVALLDAEATDYWPDSWPDPMEVRTASDRDRRDDSDAPSWDAEGGAH